MKVIRNFKKGETSNVFKISEQFIKQHNKEEDVEKLSDLFYKNNVLAKDNKNAKVAASKIIWVFNHDCPIMDNYNKTVLSGLAKCKIDSYEQYCKIWKDKYKEKEKQIEKQISNYHLEKIDSIFEETWFKQRVFDMFLQKLRKE
jgi:hypothetical protein